MHADTSHCIDNYAIKHVFTQRETCMQSNIHNIKAHVDDKVERMLTLASLLQLL